MVAKTSRLFKPETDIAVLQVRVDNIEEKFDDIKKNLEAVSVSVQQNAESTKALFKEHANATKELLQEVQQHNAESHSKLEKKISALEKWRWMMMGAGVVLGTLGYDTVAKLLK